jgi:hypothetical protein
MRGGVLVEAALLGGDAGGVVACVDADAASGVDLPLCFKSMLLAFLGALLRQDWRRFRVVFTINLIAFSSTNTLARGIFSLKLK